MGVVELMMGATEDLSWCEKLESLLRADWSFCGKKTVSVSEYCEGDDGRRSEKKVLLSGPGLTNVTSNEGHWPKLTKVISLSTKSSTCDTRRWTRTAVRRIIRTSRIHPLQQY